MRSKSAVAAIVLLALFATQATATIDVVNIWRYPQNKDRTDTYSATCDLPGRVSSNIVYKPLAVTIGTDETDVTPNVFKRFPATPRCVEAGDKSVPKMPGASFALGETRVYCEASVDEVPNFNATLSFILKLVDMTPPVITIKDPVITINALPTPPGLPTYDYSGNVAITDACDASPSVTCSPPVNSQFSVGSTTVTCRGNDITGNTAEPKTFVIIVKDITPPVLPTVLTTDTVITREAEGPDGNQVPELGTYIATDNVDGNVQVICTPGPSTRFAVNTTTVVACSATDKAGNVANGTITVRIVDTTPPTILIAQPPRLVANTPGGGMPLDIRPFITIEDFKKVDPNPTYTCVPPVEPTPIFALDTNTTVTCTATDKYGNSASNTTVVENRDVTPPTMPAVQLTPGKPYLSVSLDNETTGTVPNFGNATDTVWGSVALVCTPPAGTTLPLTGETVNVVCTATDGSGNTATETYPIRIERPPSVLTLTVPANQTLNATSGPTGAAFPYTVTATDSLGNPALKIKCVDPAVTPALVVLDTTATPSASPATGSKPEAVFGLGTTVIVCTVTNRVGSTATEAFQITVTDQTPPVVTGSNWQQEATGKLTPIMYQEKTSLSANDDITPKPNLPITCEGVPAGSPPAFPVGKTPLVCTTVDGAGNRATPITVVVTVVDTTPPVCPPLDIQQNYSVNPVNGQNITEAAFPGCTDLVDDKNLTCSCTPTLPTTLGVTAPPTTYTVSCTCADQSGNPTTVTTKTTILDNSSPLLVTPANMEVEAQNPLGATVNFTVVGRTVTNTLLPVTVTCDDTPNPFSATVAPGPSGSDFVGEFGPVSSRAKPLPINCTATATNPANGKTTTGSFTITVLDRVGPSVEQQADITVEAPTTGGVSVLLPTPKATDFPTASPVDPNPTVSCSNGPGPVTFEYSATPYVISCTATDKYGNTGAPMTYKVTVTKGKVPDLQCPANIRVAITPCQAYVSSAYTVTVVNGSVPVCTPPSPVKVQLGKPVTVVCTSSNRFGDDSCNFTITAADLTPPVVYVPCNINREGNVYGGIYLTNKDITCTAKDNVDGHITPVRTIPSTVTYNADKKRYLFPVGTTTISCTATDKSKNSATKSFNVTVTDTKAPCINTNFCKRNERCAQSAAGRVVNFKPVANDVVSGSVTVMISIDGGAPFAAPATKTVPLGVHTIKYTATDKAGNKAVETVYKYEVEDCEAPKITTPKPSTGNMYFYYDASSTSGLKISSLPKCTATDNITPVEKLVLTYTPGNNVLFTPGPHKIHCSTQDEAGNYAEEYYMIFIRTTQHHCSESYRHSANLHPSCGVPKVLSKYNNAVALRKSSFEICSCQAEVDRHMNQGYVQTLGRKNIGAWSRCVSSYNKAKMLTGCGRSSARRMLA